MKKIFYILRYLFFAWALPFGLAFFFLLSNYSDGNKVDLIISAIFVFLLILGFQHHGLEFIHETKRLDSEIDKLFNDSNYFLYIISPYFNAGENRLKSILNARGKGCDVTILVHNNALNDMRAVDELKRLQKADCKIFLHPHLHSKIYLNEKTAITGSVNLVKGSFENSLEIGVSTTNVRHHRKMLRMIKNKYFDSGITTFNADDIKKGFCIKTKVEISYNEKHPIRYEAWDSNDKSGEYCHGCGNPAKTTADDPLCGECKNTSTIPKE